MAEPETAEEEAIPFENVELMGSIPVLPDPDSQADSPAGVLKHVGVFAEALCAATGACAAFTYEGHHPEKSRALDITVSPAIGLLPTDDNVLGDSVARFTLDNWTAHKVLYIIWRQRINSNDDRGWRGIEDRGDLTQNHFDHCHVSFLKATTRRTS